MFSKVCNQCWKKPVLTGQFLLSQGWSSLCIQSGQNFHAWREMLIEGSQEEQAAVHLTDQMTHN